jgi:multiple sugar transport system substrate-binding protein
VPEQQQRQKAMIEFTTGRPMFDVLMLALHVQKRLAFKGRWLEDLRPMLADASMTLPDLDWNDFSDASVKFSTQSDGSLPTMPNFMDYSLL